MTATTTTSFVVARIDDGGGIVVVRRRSIPPSTFVPPTFRPRRASSSFASMMSHPHSSPRPSKSTEDDDTNENYERGVDALWSYLLATRQSDRTNDVMVGEDSGTFDLRNEKWGSLSNGTGWITFLVAVSAMLSAVAVLWIYPPTGYGDDFVHLLEADVAHGNSHLVTLMLGLIFPVVHSGLASLRPYGETMIGPRAYRVLFAFPSLCLAYTWIVYFVNHAHDGHAYYDLSNVGWVHSLAWITNFVSFLFLYPSVYNLKEVAAIDVPKVHLWETGIVRITRHPQYVGQCMWSAAHLAMIGTSFTALTMTLLVLHHYLACWNGDRRLLAQYGEDFVAIRDRTSIMPFRAIWEGRQILPSDYWRELVRPPLLIIAAGSVLAYLAHPYMQAGAALSVNAGWVPGGIFSPR